MSNLLTVGVCQGCFTTYKIRAKTNLPIFKRKESTVEEDFEWLRSELERESKVVVSSLPGKALLASFLLEEIFDDSLMEESKQGLEQVIL